MEAEEWARAEVEELQAERAAQDELQRAAEAAAAARAERLELQRRGKVVSEGRDDVSEGRDTIGGEDEGEGEEGFEKQQKLKLYWMNALLEQKKILDEERAKAAEEQERKLAFLRKALVQRHDQGTRWVGPVHRILKKRRKKGTHSVVGMKNHLDF